MDTLDTRIDAAAASLLTEVGADFTMEQLAARAQVPRATLYRHIGSKQALLTRLAAHAAPDAGVAPDPRIRILLAARRVFAQAGLAGATMEQIAAEAQVGVATVYRHFGDKDGLIRAFIAELSPRPVVRELAEPTADVAADLRALATTLLPFFYEYRDILRLILTAEATERAYIEQLRTGSDHTLDQLESYFATQTRRRAPGGGGHAAHAGAGVSGPAADVYGHRADALRHAARRRRPDRRPDRPTVHDGTATRRRLVMALPSSPDSAAGFAQPDANTRVETTTCCIVGAGPAGAMLALLLARQGVPVVLLEAHRDFERAFRGDTLHPAVLELLDQLGLADRLLALRHATVRAFNVPTTTGNVTVDLFGTLRTRFPYITVTGASTVPGVCHRGGRALSDVCAAHGLQRGWRDRGAGGHPRRPLSRDQMAPTNCAPP